MGVCESNNPLPESHSILRKCREMLVVATIATMETKIFNRLRGLIQNIPTKFHLNLISHQEVDHTKINKHCQFIIRICSDIIISININHLQLSQILGEGKNYYRRVILVCHPLVLTQQVSRLQQKSMTTT